MENRGQKYHRERRGEALREEIATLVEGELEDPRIGLVAVNEVQVTPDGKTARVFVQVDGDDKAAAESMEGLAASVGYIKHQLVANLGLRHSPELIFILDRSEQHGNRIEELLTRIKKRKR
ncbi:MAG: 30S ribosome-binding factor RbfA [Candidatus Korobacteraceae bacterium]